MTNSIVIYATEVPVITGDNRWGSLAQCFESVVKRYNYGLFQQCGFVDKKAVISKVCPSVDAVDAKVDTPADTLKAREQHIAKVLKDVDENLVILKKFLGENAASEVIDTAESRVRCAHGVRKEASVLQWYSERYNTKVTTSAKFVKAPLPACNGMRCFVGGRVDGTTQDTVIEVKCRVNKLLKRLIQSERVQLQTYLYILNLPKGDLVEAYGSDHFVIHTAQDSKEWDTRIQPMLTRFCQYLARFLKQPDQEYLKLQTDGERCAHLAKLISK